MNIQIPVPSFEDLLKLLQFWIDQKDKWFYFELGTTQSRSKSEKESAPRGFYAKHVPLRDTENEILYYVQSRVIGKIHEVIYFPPSLLLTDATLFTVNFTFERQGINVNNVEKRKKYGLVFSQISYYEPIDDVDIFLKKDPRVSDEKK